MEVISRASQSSSLNPNAPLFVPLAYRTVEDFSDEWWALVHSSPWFRDYWLQECFQDPQSTQLLSEFDDAFFPEIDALLEDDEEGNKAYNKDLIPMGSLKWKKNRFVAETPKYREKAPKIVNVKVSPRPIQQPR